MPGVVSHSVEGIWQGLKVFEKEGIDVSKFKITNMRNLKRSAGKKRGKCLGHLLNGKLLGYAEARKELYLPVYAKLVSLVGLDALIVHEKLALVDYTTNGDVNDLSSPLSHASLLLCALLCNANVTT